MENPNPFKLIRIERGYTLHEFALVTGVSVPAIHQVEQGATKNPVKILDALEDLGHDKAKLESEYSKWRRIRKSKKISGFLRRGTKTGRCKETKE